MTITATTQTVRSANTDPDIPPDEYPAPDHKPELVPTSPPDFVPGPDPHIPPDKQPEIAPDTTPEISPPTEPELTQSQPGPKSTSMLC